MSHHPFSDDILSFRPSSFYFRRDLRTAKTAEAAKEIGLAIIAEHERLRGWVRDQGLIPPKWVVSPDEAKAKGWRDTG